MRAVWWMSALALALLTVAGRAQDVQPANWGRRNAPPPNCPPCLPDATPVPNAPAMPNDPNAASAPSSAAAALDEGARGAALASGQAAMPAFFGDLIGYSATRVVRDAHGNTRLVRVPIAARSGTKITDNESPRPTDRVFYTYNYFNDVNIGVNPGLPGVGLARHMVGFEKTLLDGDCSFGMRLPFSTITNTGGADGTFAGDLSLIFKYAFVNDRQTGDVLSGGLMLTVPTGQDIVVDQPNPLTGVVDGTTQDRFHPVIFQPFAGFIRSFNERLYVHGFTAVAVPTDARDVTIMWNDLGVGYRLYRNPNDRFIQAVIPTWEWHLNTPFTHRSAFTQPIGFSDQLNMTGGCYFQFPRSLLGVAAGFPVVGPRPFGVEAIASFTFRF
ncbi:MAG: hypothetical protein ACJ8F7_10715 [Gemmataceae bacterium]